MVGGHVPARQMPFETVVMWEELKKVMKIMLDVLNEPHRNFLKKQVANINEYGGARA